MIKYINSGKLIESIKDMRDTLNGYSDAFDKSEIISVVEDQPECDVVEVVRCKDCAHLDRDRPLSKIRDTDHFFCNVMNRYLPTYGYCYYGE